ncbi:MAG: 16S rRNA (cytosine(967)-C(5))-methyltransferase RsmB [Lachnospiraceae bacterium]|nr:16S rRNA (cytosine(967)-C(5))-methyltransferase RsmB [Lachnospiraceae bacterium]
MSGTVNVREIILGVLMEITEEEAYSHIALRQVLEKYQYLDKRDRAFISRTTEGTLEYMLQLDYIIECFTKVPVYNMKPLIRNLLRMSVYQLKYMDSVPDSAVVNEAVKLAQRRGFYNLKGFVNGVLRAVARGLDQVEWPDPQKDPLYYLSVVYSMPVWILEKWLDQFGAETVEKICRSFHETKDTTVRCNLSKASKEEIVASLEAQGVVVKQHPYLDYALELSGYNYLQAIEAFKKDWIRVQDVSSMLVAEIAAPNWGSICLDVCAAPGGKSLHLAEKLRSSGLVEARDISEGKVRMMTESFEKYGDANVRAVVMDATVKDPDSVGKADIVLADVPCSGLGVIGRKQDIKYKMTQARQDEIVRLQRKILHVVQEYVKPGGVLIYSTCTIGADENQKNLQWFLEYFPFKLESIDSYIPEQLRSKTTRGGYIQLLPGVHQTDGFFIARLRRLK